MKECSRIGIGHGFHGIEISWWNCSVESGLLWIIINGIVMATIIL